MGEQIRAKVAKGNVTVYLPLDVLERCRAAADEDGRSLSNYLSGLLERAHPPSGDARLDVILGEARSFEKRGLKSSRRK